MASKFANPRAGLYDALTSGTAEAASKFFHVLAMIDKTIKTIAGLAPFLEPYPLWVKGLFFAWIVLSAALFATLVLTRAPATASADAFVMPPGKYRVAHATGFDEAFSSAVLEIEPDVMRLRLVALSGDYNYTVRYLGQRNAIKGEVVAADERQLVGQQLQGSVLDQGSFFELTINLIESRKVLQLTCPKERVSD